MDEELFWKTLCRTPDLDRSIGTILELISLELPLQGAVIELLDFAEGRARRVAEAWRPGRAVPEAPAVPRWGEAQVEELRAWHRSLAPRRGLTAQDPALQALWGEAGARDVIALPLRDEGFGAGAALLTGAAGAFMDVHEAWCVRLVEPLSLAWAADRRFHELSLLRETLEADKRALLTRLDRQEIVEEVVGADAGLAAVMEQARQVAPTDAPVLIFGETGAGKEVLARAIHARSRRPRGPMVRVNCGAIPPGLVDSELFGHERGSFTGAVATRPGWFERADGGTLFLDEIGELPPDAQVRLLRVLQEGVLERVGGTRPIRVDVRVVAATHRNLEELARQGKFREDLWYRLSVFPLYLPPLRERPQDIPELAAHFAARAGRRLGGAALAPSAADLDLLLAYDWPGNVRELAAVIERAAILGDGRALDLPRALGGRAARSSLPPPPPPAAAAGPVPGPAAPLATLDEAMRRHIAAALAHTRGRIEGPGGAAALLAINPHTLRARMRRLGVDWARFRTTG